ncbi:hypothetical protein SAY87_030645 [Trapa incisa]|uniref:Uncharacterized protein n=1 Tax=Trapa incisa TaxID=236973 RepID=A0AAN7KJ41_9MYRT|nr:hypothetical protein SAY87_030645 [Trapa incisa]
MRRVHAVDVKTGSLPVGWRMVGGWHAVIKPRRISRLLSVEIITIFDVLEEYPRFCTRRIWPASDNWAQPLLNGTKADFRTQVWTSRPVTCRDFLVHATGHLDLHRRDILLHTRSRFEFIVIIRDKADTLPANESQDGSCLKMPLELRDPVIILPRRVTEV